MSRLATADVSDHRIPAAWPFKISAFSAPSLYAARGFIGCLPEFLLLLGEQGSKNVFQQKLKLKGVVIGNSFQNRCAYRDVARERYMDVFTAILKRVSDDRTVRRVHLDELVTLYRRAWRVHRGRLR